MDLQPQAENFVWVGWQSAITMLGMSDLKSLVEKAFDRGFIDRYARTTRKSGEYRRMRGRTYCPGATIRASIWGIPIDVSRIDCMSGAVQARAQT